MELDTDSVDQEAQHQLLAAGTIQMSHEHPHMPGHMTPITGLSDMQKQILSHLQRTQPNSASHLHPQANPQAAAHFLPPSHIQAANMPQAQMASLHEQVAHFQKINPNSNTTGRFHFFSVLYNY